MYRIDITNQKGGVGKTVIACHLSFYLQELGLRVLHIDLDPQGNSSKTLAQYASGITSSQLFADDPITITKNDDGITLISADPGLTRVERAEPAVIQHLIDHLNNLDKTFDVCVIDTAPTDGLRMKAALIVATHVLAPFELEGYSIDGIVGLIRTILGIRQRQNPDLMFLGLLANRYNPQSPNQKANLEDLLSKYPQFMFPQKITTRTSIAESIAAGLPVWKWKKTSAREAGVEMRRALATIVEKIGDMRNG